MSFSSLPSFRPFPGDFDYGRERRNLVAMILSWIPVEEPKFLARLKESIRPGGHLAFEHVLRCRHFTDSQEAI